MLQFVGRVYASACGSHGTELFYTNDEGTYMVQFRDKTPDAVQEFETLDDREKIIQAFRANTVKISDGRLSVPMIPGVTQPFNWWNANQPGSTLFMPISDVTWEYINVLMLLMDEPNSLLPLRRPERQRGAAEGVGRQGLPRPHARLPAIRAGERMQMIIVRHGAGDHAAEHVPGAAGDGPGRVDLHVVRRASSSWPLMGFRFDTSASAKGPIKPLIPASHACRCVGLDGDFQAYCPPYYPDMGAAVQAIWDAKWGGKRHLQGRGRAGGAEGPPVAGQAGEQDAGLVPGGDEGVLRLHLGDVRRASRRRSTRWR